MTRPRAPWRAAAPLLVLLALGACGVEAGESAEIAVTYPTTEGDPIRSWFRLTGDEMELYEDATADSFGSGEWMFHTCAPPERLGRVISCG